LSIVNVPDIPNKKFFEFVFQKIKKDHKTERCYNPSYSLCQLGNISAHKPMENLSCDRIIELFYQRSFAEKSICEVKKKIERWFI
jgi:hypothetical protein